MNIKRLLYSCVAVFGFVFIYEWVFHGVILKETYEQTASLWRPQSDMGSYFVWLTLGQFLFCILFCIIFTKGYENRGLVEGAPYGALMGLIFCAPNLIFYAVQPLPGSLVVAWCVGGMIEITLAGVLLATVYRPAAS